MEETKPSKPDCYKCVHCQGNAGTCHKRCNNIAAKVTGHEHGIRKGWFMWPLNFDPTWLISCDGFSDDPKDVKPTVRHDPLLELMAILR
jgi:hypothetical protein